MKIHQLGIIVIGFIIGSCTSNSLEEMMDCDSTQITLTVESITGTECGLMQGSATVIVSGGSEPYTYSIAGGNSQMGSIFESLPAGSHEIMVTDANGCTAMTEAVVLNIDGVNVESEVTNASCGVSSGSITVNATDGVEPYSFSLDGEASQSSNEFANLSAGLHTVTVTDSEGCAITIEERVFSGVSFELDVASIISTNCAISGCHAGNQSPDFRSFDNIQGSAARIRVRTQNGTMPRNGSLTQNEIDLIACWVDDGALNN